MELNLKGLDQKDMNAFHTLPSERAKIIHGSSPAAIKTTYTANQLASSLHPDIQYVKVAKIIEENDQVKTFVLVPNTEEKTQKLAYFRPGQCISIELKIDGGIYRRPYTITSSPKDALENFYTITVKRKKGIVSNYLFDHIKVNDTFSVSGPTGTFYYEPLRDAKNVIALVEGIGINQIISMALAIQDKILDCKLTIFYSVKTEKDILFLDKLIQLNKKNSPITIIILLSEEEKENYLHGFITKEMLDQYKEPETSFFISGSLSFYDRVNELLKEYNLSNKYIRHESFFGRVAIQNTNTYTITILSEEKEISIPCNGKETLLEAMEKNGISAPSRCHVGDCGFCRSKLKSGVVRTFNNILTKADEENEYIHPCASFPESDIVIELPY